MLEIESPNPRENLTTFAPCKTIETQMIWFSNIIICIHCAKYYLRRLETIPLLFMNFSEFLLFCPRQTTTIPCLKQWNFDECFDGDIVMK